MSSEEERAKVVCYWWAKAEESLASARRELDAGAYPFAVNRLYYAAFYGVSAALLERQLTFVKHSGVRAAFHREFIKTGLLEVQWEKLLQISKRSDSSCKSPNPSISSASPFPSSTV